MKKIRSFTLMELMFGTAILLVVFLGLLLSYVKCISLNEIARDITVATEDARRVIEQIRSLAEDSLSSITAEDWTNWAANNGCNTLPQEQVQVVYTDNDGTGNPLDDDPLTITVNVNWQTKAVGYNLNLSTLVTKR